jgi:hypothetical protein
LGLACGLAILSKGLAGLVPLLVAALAIALIPGFATIGAGGLMLALTLAAMVVAPWLIAESLLHGRLFWSTFGTQETLLRVMSHLEAEPRTKAFYTLRTFVGEISYLWAIIFPLAGLVVVAVGTGMRSTMRRFSPTILVWILWLGLALGAACAVQTKLGWYVLPALIPMAAIGGAIFGAAFGASGGDRRACQALAAVALAVMLVEAPAQWEQHEQAFRMQRERSTPAYVLGMHARSRGLTRASPELYFAGVELPTLVYYSGMRCNFVTPSAASGLGLVDPGGAVIQIGYHQLVMADRYGATSTIGNLDEEWNLSSALRVKSYKSRRMVDQRPRQPENTIKAAGCRP